jgi:hypothetical protein
MTNALPVQSLFKLNCLSLALLHLLLIDACSSHRLVFFLGCRRLFLVLAYGGSYSRLHSFCFASVWLTVLVMLLNAHFLFSGVLNCSVCIHA